MMMMMMMTLNQCLICIPFLGPDITAFPALQDDFRTRYQLLSLHSWLVLSRLRGCGSAGGTLREELCERMWDDTFRAARQMGVSEFRIGSQVKMLQQSFLGSALAYDKGMVRACGLHSLPSKCVPFFACPGVRRFVEYFLLLLLPQKVVCM